jgi:hypothetical protein
VRCLHAKGLLSWVAERSGSVEKSTALNRSDTATHAGWSLIERNYNAPWRKCFM